MKTRLSAYRDLAIEYFHLEFSDRPLVVKEFLDAHNAINTPWFRIRLFFALWRESIGEWLRKCVRGKPGSESADRYNRSFKS